MDFLDLLCAVYVSGKACNWMGSTPRLRQTTEIGRAFLSFVLAMAVLCLGPTVGGCLGLPWHVVPGSFCTLGRGCKCVLAACILTARSVLHSMILSAAQELTTQEWKALGPC